MNNVKDPSVIKQDILKILPYMADEDEMKGVRFFVTGGTGFVGIWLLETLLELSDARGLEPDITVLTRRPDAFAQNCPELASRVTLLKGDISSFAAPEGSYKYIIHAAAETNAAFNDKYPLSQLDSIVWGTRRVLDFASRCGCEKLLYVSSGAVYGAQPPDLKLIDEDYGGAPDVTAASGAVTYAECKRMAEHMCCLYSEQFGFDTKIARLFAFLGPHLPLNEHFAAGNFIADALNRREIIVAGDGTPFRSYMYPADMVLWLLNILFKGEKNRPYNVGSDEAISISELAHSVADAVVPSLNVKILKEPAPGIPAKRYVPSVERARREFGLELRFDLRECIERTLRWYRDFHEVN